jgi:NADPH:quinone reductase-like Zn-dependent oxidoreductase
MRAVQLSAPGSVHNLRPVTLALPPDRDGWVRIRVEAFGLNRSELKLRLGLSVGVSFPRVPGIEAAGTVDAAPPGSGLARGQRVVAMMGDMGRTYDGGYAEYTSVPRAGHPGRHRPALGGAVRDFSPNEYLPRGVRLAGYFGDAADLPPAVFQEIVDAVAAGQLAFPVDRVYDGLEQVPQAHDDMEHDRAAGKLVVRVRH